MENPELALEITTYVQSLVHSSKLLYQTYSLEVRLLGLVLLAWASFKVGKKTVVDPLEEEVKQMKIIMATRDQYTIVIPKKIKYLGTRNTILFVLLILTAIAYFAWKHFKPQIMGNVDVELLILGGGLMMVIILLTWLYQLYLKFKLRRGNYNDQQIINKIGNIVKMLGSKAQTLLKYFLCKEVYNMYHIKQTGECRKQKCKQYRGLLEQKFKGVANLVNNVINFEWCMACKKRQTFDQYLDFQFSSYNEEDQDTDKEDNLVNNKNTYLLKQVQKMAKWVKEVGPCNCSQRYWYQSKKQISQFKRKEKQLSPQLAIFEVKNK